MDKLLKKFSKYNECPKGCDSSVLPLCSKTALGFVLDESMNNHPSDRPYSMSNYSISRWISLIK